MWGHIRCGLPGIINAMSRTPVLYQTASVPWVLLFRGAIGAKLVHPDRKVLAICGDGGFLMNVQELETARRIGANIVIMIWDDSSYGLIEWKQQNEFGKHTDLKFNNPDFIKLAESFDCIGMRVENARDLNPTLLKAFEADRPVLLSLPIDYRENLKLTKRLGSIQCAI